MREGLDLLADLYPHCFDRENRRPLKVGICEEVIAQHPELGVHVREAIELLLQTRAGVTKAWIIDQLLEVERQEGALCAHSCCRHSDCATLVRTRWLMVESRVGHEANGLGSHQISLWPFISLQGSYSRIVPMRPRLAPWSH